MIQMRYVSKKVLLSVPLFLVIFIDSIGIGLIFPILSSIIIDPKVSILAHNSSLIWRDTLYGIVVGIFMLCWFFGAAVISDLSDVIGRKKSLFICLGGAFLGYFLSGVAIYYKSIPLLILGRIIAGFTAGSQAVAQASIIDIAPENKKATFIGYVLLSSSIGFIAGPMIGGLMSNSNYISWFDFSTPMYTASILSFVNIMLLVILYKESAKIDIKVKIHVTRAITLFIDAFKNKNICYLSAIFFIYILGWSNFFSFISMFSFYVYHFSPTEIAFLMCLIGLGFSIAMGYLVGILNKYFRPHYIVMWSLLICGLLNILVITISYSVVLWVLAAPIATTSSVAYATIISIYSNQVDSKKQGWVMGISTSIMALGFAITSFLSGMIIHFSYYIAIIISASGLIVGSLMTIRLIKNPLFLIKKNI